MNIYEPYIEVDDPRSLLHLHQSKKYKIVSVLTSGILPLLLFILIFLSFFISEITITIWLMSGLFFIICSIIILFKTSVGYELSFKESAIELNTLKLFGKKVRTYLLIDIDYIELELFNEPRLSGAYYRLVLKNGGRVVLLKISTPLNFPKEQFRELDTRIESLTGLKIRGNLDKLA